MNTNTTTQNTNPQVSAVLAQIERFGFKYYGNGENNEPLVLAPNGQVIPLKIAYDFVQMQIKKAAEQQSGGGSLEQMPVMPPSVESSALETSVEKSAEKETTIEKAAEKQNNVQTAQSNPVSTTTPAAPIEIKMPMPFDEGFKITKFDPTDLNQVEDYIQTNKNGSTSSTSTWLANQFEKFLQEYKIKK